MDRFMYSLIIRQLEYDGLGQISQYLSNMLGMPLVLPSNKLYKLVNACIQILDEPTDISSSECLFIPNNYQQSTYTDTSATDANIMEKLLWYLKSYTNSNPNDGIPNPLETLVQQHNQMLREKRQAIRRDEQMNNSRPFDMSGNPIQVNVGTPNPKTRINFAPPSPIPIPNPAVIPNPSVIPNSSPAVIPNPAVISNPAVIPNPSPAVIPQQVLASSNVAAQMQYLKQLTRAGNKQLDNTSSHELWSTPNSIHSGTDITVKLSSLKEKVENEVAHTEKVANEVVQIEKEEKEEEMSTEVVVTNPDITEDKSSQLDSSVTKLLDQLLSGNGDQTTAMRAINNKYKCYICSKLTDNLVDYIAHLEQEHCDKKITNTTESAVAGPSSQFIDPQFKCDMCDKTFNKQRNLYKHKQTHSEIRPHECEQCGKRFKKRAHLQTHMTVHSAMKYHQCEQCNKVFHNKLYLLKHMRRHARGTEMVKIKTEPDEINVTDSSDVTKHYDTQNMDCSSVIEVETVQNEKNKSKSHEESCNVVSSSTLEGTPNNVLHNLLIQNLQSQLSETPTPSPKVSSPVPISSIDTPISSLSDSADT